MHCRSCKYWQPTYAPYVKSSYPYIMTCHKIETAKYDWNEKKCKYWERNEEEKK